MDAEFLSREPVLDPAAFIGRAQEIAWAAAKLGGLRPQNCNLIGEPRSGKTSLLHYLYRQRVGLAAEGRGLYVFVRLAALPEHNSATFWSVLLDELRREMAGAKLPLATAVVPTTPRDAYDQLENEIETLLAEKGLRRIIFFIDDFDLMQPGLNQHDLNWLRALANQYIDTLAFVIGSATPLVKLTESLVADQSVSPLTNLFHEYWLPLLTPAEAEMLCRQAARAEERELAATAVAFLLAEAGRHPDLLKIACEALFVAPDVMVEAVQLAVRTDLQLNEHVNWLCRQLWQRRAPAEQAALLSLAAGSAAALADRRMAAQLQRLGLVEERSGRWALFADLFRDWLLWETAVSQPTPPLRSEQPQFVHLVEERRAVVNGRSISLTPLENRLLAYLSDRPNEVCDTEALLIHVWPPDKTPSVVEKGINRLRAKIEEDPKRPRFILSARGEGYILRLP